MSHERINRRKVLSALIFKFIERTGYQLISFIVQLILARLLTPAHFGILALLVVFINISQVFVQSGLNTALIQRKDVEESDYSSVFYISLFIAVVLYGVLFICAPRIASFYRMPELSGVLRVMAVILIPGAFNSVQIAKATREMLFKKLMYSSILAGVISGTAGILMAYGGYGVWALVGQQLSHQIAICLIMLVIVRWKPHWTINFGRVKIFFAFGWKLLCSALLDTLYMNLQSLVIGRKYDASTLGYYNRGSQFPQLIIANVNSSIQTVMLPTLSKQQDNTVRMKEMMRRSVVTSSFVIFPLMMGLAMIAEPLVSLLLTDKWLPAVPYLRIYCFVFAFWPIHTANLQALNAQGRSDWFLKLEVIKKAYGIAILLITVFFFDSPIAIAVGLAVSTVISCFVNASPNKKLLGYGYAEQMRDILPSFLLSLVMGLSIYTLLWLQLPALATMIIQIFIGAVIYIALAWLLKLECFMYLVKIAKEFWVSRKKQG